MRRSDAVVDVPGELGMCHNKLFASDTYPCTACEFAINYNFKEAASYLSASEQLLSMTILTYAIYNKQTFLLVRKYEIFAWDSNLSNSQQIQQDLHS